MVWAAQFLLSPSAVADPVTVGDAAGLFNERGYLKSNAFSLDGNELINDFNGNLIYTKRLKYLPITQNGIHFDLKITYNGSVGHQVNATLNRIPTTDYYRQNSFNAPEWIISVNNVAVQTFNFENEAITWPNTRYGIDTAAGEDAISELITGYHTCYALNRLGGSETFATISILQGDGSVRQFTSLGYSPQGDHDIIRGEYRPFSKTDHAKAFVDSLDNLTIFEEDGTLVKFELFVPKWRHEIKCEDPVTPADFPLIYLLTEFGDRFGNSFCIQYEKLFSKLGRPLVGAAYEAHFQWETAEDAARHIKYVRISDGGNATISYVYLNTQAGLSVPAFRTDTCRGYVTKISDNASRETEFSYMQYRRTGRNYANGDALAETNNFVTDFYGEYPFNVVDTSDVYRGAWGTIAARPWRLYKVVEPDGGTTYYSYYDDARTAWPPNEGRAVDSLEVDYDQYCSADPDADYPCVRSTAFNAIGRDPFFNNMVTAKRRVLIDSTDTTMVSFDTLSYLWQDSGDVNVVGTDDYFLTKRRCDSLGDFGGGPTTWFTYRYYREQLPRRDDNRERGWAIKLLSDSTMDGQNVLRATRNYWNGITLLLDSTKTTVDGIPSMKRMRYVFGAAADVDSVSTLLKKTISDDWLVTEEYYVDSFLNIQWPDGYYDNTLVDSTIVRSTADTNTILSKTVNTFYDSTDVNGYIGQLEKSSVLQIDSGQVEDSSVTVYTYYKNPYKSYLCRGSLETVTDPVGYMTRYVYDSSTTEVFDSSKVHAVFIGTSDKDTLLITQDGIARFSLSVQGSENGNTHAFVQLNGEWLADVFGDGLDEEESGSFRVAEGDTVTLTAIVGVHETGTVMVDGAVFFDIYTDNMLNPVTYYQVNIDGSVDTVSTRFNTNGPSWYKKIQYTGDDSLISYQKVNKDGLVKIAVDPNHQSAVFQYDGVDRIRKILLPGSNRNYSLMCDTIYPTFDADWTDSLEHCSSSILHMVDTSGTAESSAYFQFPANCLDGLTSDDLRWAYLRVYCKMWHKYSLVNILGFHESTVACGDSITPLDSNLGHTNLYDCGYLRLLITDVIRQWLADTSLTKTFALVPRSGLVDALIYSLDCSDPAKRPRLEIEYGSIPDSTYTMEWEYDDRTTDGDPVGVTVITKPDTTGFAPVKRVWFDGFGRLSQADFVDSAGTYDSVVTAYDFLDRHVRTTDQEGYSTRFVYDVLDRLETTHYLDSVSSSVNMYYDGTWADSIGLDSLMNLANSGLYRTRTRNENLDSTFEYRDTRSLPRLQQSYPDDSTELRTYFDYDELGNLTRVIRPKGDEVNYAYNNLGWLLWEVSADQDTIWYQYDKNGNVVATKDGNLRAQDNAQSSHWRYTTYDALGRITEQGLLDRDSSTGIGTETPINRLFYDQFNSANSRGQLSLAYSTINGYRYGEKYDYDERGRLVKQRNHFLADLDSTFVYDSIYVERQDTGADTIFFRFPRVDTLYYSLQTSGFTDASTYILIRRNWEIVDSIKYPSSPPGTPDTVTGFVVCTWGDYIDVIVNVAAADSGTTSLYGRASYLTSRQKQKYMTGTAYQVDYEYNAADQVTSITYPFGCNLKVVYDYDDRGRLKTVGDTSNPTRFATFYYTSRDEIDHVVLGDSLQVVDYTYNPRGWLSAINDGSSDTSAAGDLFGEQLYYYDYAGQGWTGEKNGNIMAQKVSMAGTDQVRHYGYDDIDRLTAVTELDSSLESGLESFSYDGNGNRLSYQQIVDQDTNSTAYSYRSTGNILESLSSTTGNRNFGWDDNGNMVSDSRLGTLSHLYYDVFNQLEEVLWTDLIGDDYIKFGYSVDGERVYKEYKYYYRDICDGHEWLPPDGLTVAGDDSLGVTTLGSGTLPPDDTLCIFSKTTSTRYVRSRGKVLVEYVGSPIYSRQFSFIYAGDQRIAMIDKDGKLHFYLNDHLGSARMVIDTAGTVKDNYDYYAFGEAFNQTISTGQAYGYTGKPYDDDHSLNLHYYGARYYDATTGRFPQIDPLANKNPAWSPYIYTLNNPIKLVDPDGKEAGPVLSNSNIQGSYLQTGLDLAYFVVQAVSIELSLGPQAGAGPLAEAGAELALKLGVEPEVSAKVGVESYGCSAEGQVSLNLANGAVTGSVSGDILGLAKNEASVTFNPQTYDYSASSTFSLQASAAGFKTSVGSKTGLFGRGNNNSKSSPVAKFGVKAGIGIKLVIDPNAAKVPAPDARLTISSYRQLVSQKGGN